jgi:hypothetical protein
MPEPFELLRETLLRAGVAPMHVRRYLRELSEHYTDLVGEALEAGRSADEAKAAARARLGGDEALAAAMLAEPSLRSWTGRAPWATLVLGPCLLLVLAWIAPALLVVLVLLSARAVHPYPPPPAWLPPVDEALFNLVQFGGPLLIAGCIALLAARQRSLLIWPLLGCAVIAVFGDSLHWNAHWPTAASHRPRSLDPRSLDLSLSIGFRGFEMRGQMGHFNLAVWSQSLPLVAFSLAVAGVVYWMARRRPLAVV